MSQITSQVKTALPRLPVVAGIATLGIISSVALAYCTPNHQTATAQIAPAQFAVQDLRLLDSNSGISTIHLDDFYITTSFDFSTFSDSYGVPQSEFTAVEIHSLAIDRITDHTGRQYPDFTDHTDIINIKSLITAYVERHQLAGA